MLTCKVSLITLSIIALCCCTLQYVLGFHPVLNVLIYFCLLMHVGMYVYFVNFSVSFDNVRHHYCIVRLGLFRLTGVVYISRLPLLLAVQNNFSKLRAI